MADEVNHVLPRVLAVGGATSPELSNRNRGGPAPLEQICRLFGYKAGVYTVRDLAEFRRTIKFIGKVAKLPEFDACPLLVHISVAGDSNGMQIGPDRVSWKQLTEIVADLMREFESYSRPFILVLSAQGASVSELREILLNLCDSTVSPPEKMFVFVDRIATEIDKILAWTHFYGAITAIDFTVDSLEDVRETGKFRTRLRQLGLGSIQNCFLKPPSEQNFPILTIGERI